jgi:CheY-like chemotaxis protein
MESESGRGSTFRFYLPAGSDQVAAAANSGRRSATCSGRILVMDDEPALRGVLTGMLTRLGCEPVACANAAEARSALTQATATARPFALMILDLTIQGGTGGLALLQDVRQDGVTIPAIAVSGYSDDPVMAAPAEHGFAASLPKPFSLSALSQALERALPPRPTS